MAIMTLPSCSESEAMKQPLTRSLSFAPERSPEPATVEEALERLGVPRDQDHVIEPLKGAVVEADVAGFSFGLPGDLSPGSGVGVWDTMIHAPGIRFPLEEAPAYINTQVWGVGGLEGPTGSQCAGQNYGYPWRDNYCETRHRDDSECPGGSGQLGVDIRPATCEDDTHWAVAAEDGVIRKIGAYSVVLRGARSGLDFHYLHLSTDKLAVRRGQEVRAGDRIGLVSNDFGDTPTTVHLHFEIRREVEGAEGGQSVSLPPYLSLVEAYLRMLPGEHPTTVAGVLGALAGPGVFKECDACPQMAEIEAATARIGALDGDEAAASTESPVRQIAVPRFAIGLTEVTFAQWDACAAEGYCHPIFDHGGSGRGARPVVNVSRWDITGAPDVAPAEREGPERGFIAWLNSKVEDAPYRLPSEAEWEYAARGGAETLYAFGEALSPEMANFDARFMTEFPTAVRFRRGTTPAGALAANGFGLHEMHGNVWEWTADCWSETLEDLPGDGAPYRPDAESGRDGCALGVRRGGSLLSDMDDLRASRRVASPPGRGAPDLGFRVARTLPPKPPISPRLLGASFEREDDAKSEAAGALAPGPALR